MSETLPKDDAITVECELPDPPEKVWRALTVPEILAAWMMPNDIDPTVGSRFSFGPTNDNAKVDCNVLDAEPGRLLRYSWRERSGGAEADSTVTFVLARTVSGGTHLTIVHGGFALASNPVAMLAGAGCRLSAPADRPRAALPVPANTARLFLRAA